MRANVTALEVAASTQAGKVDGFVSFLAGRKKAAVAVTKASCCVGPRPLAAKNSRNEGIKYCDAHPYIRIRERRPARVNNGLCQDRRTYRTDHVQTAQHVASASEPRAGITITEAHARRSRPLRRL